MHRDAVARQGLCKVKRVFFNPSFSHKRPIIHSKRPKIDQKSPTCSCWAKVSLKLIKRVLSFDLFKASSNERIVRTLNWSAKSPICRDTLAQQGLCEKDPFCFPFSFPPRALYSTERGLKLLKSALFCTFKLLYGVKRALHLIKEPYIWSKEPYIWSKEPYIWSKEPCVYCIKHGCLHYCAKECSLPPCQATASEMLCLHKHFAKLRWLRCCGSTSTLQN